MSAFCKRPTAWGERLFTPCRPFAKGHRFMNHYIIMCAIDYATIKCREAQFRSRQSNLAVPSSCFAPSRSAPSTSALSSSGDVSLEDVMV